MLHFAKSIKTKETPFTDEASEVWFKKVEGHLDTRLNDQENESTLVIIMLTVCFSRQGLVASQFHSFVVNMWRWQMRVCTQQQQPSSRLIFRENRKRAHLPGNEASN